MTNATAYELFSLQGNYIQPLMTTTDTFAVFNKSNLSKYFSVAPVFDGIEGTRELTIDYSTQGVGCYFISVVPKLPIVDSAVVIDVKIGTAYKLKSATLERLDDNQFRSINLSSVSDLSFTETDSNPGKGLNQYRIRLDTENGTSIYSDTVEVFYLDSTDIYVYPNPVKAGQDVNIVVANDQDVELQLIDSNGRTVKTSNDIGVVKVISTENVIPGLYFLRTIAANGAVLFSKLIIL
jgi:hypothetical protein